MAFAKLGTETVTAMFGSESELEIEPRACFVATAAVEFGAAVEQDLEGLLGLGMVVGNNVCWLVEKPFSEMQLWIVVLAA